MDQLSAAAAVEKNQRDPLFEFAGPRAYIGGAICGRGRTHAGVDFDSGISDRDGAGFVRRQ